MRTLYIGNLPLGTSIKELLNHVMVGALEDVRMLPDRNCAFLTFLEASAPAHCCAIQSKRLILLSPDIKAGWGDPLPLLDCIQVLPEHHAAFVHMTSILTAIKAIMFLSCDPEWATCRIYYGRDRCAYPAYLAYSACPPLHLDSFYGESVGSLNTIGSETCHIQQQLIKPDSTPTAEAAATILAAIQANHSTGAYIREDHNQTEEYPNRTVYLGGIRPEVTTKELCDVIRTRLRRDFSTFGEIELINLVAEKTIAFVNFMDIVSAIAAVETMRVHPDYIRHKINFGKDRCGNPPRERSSTSISSDYGHPLPPLPPDPPPALSARSTLLSISPPSSPSSATVLSVRHMHLRHYDPNATAGNVRSHTNADAQMISNSTSMGHLRTPPSQKNEASAAVLRFTPNPMHYRRPPCAATILTSILPIGILMPSASTAHISTRPHFLSASPVYSSPSFVSDAVNGSTSMQSNILLSAMATASTGSHY
ncbi:hypothetical protein BSLG_005113 [Batrachochytrium salamandrivorans]|nr:hypothetical protein BSLG_005113 [Batrachochytrium salamandrivorans]